MAATVFLIRHAEKADLNNTGPTGGLSLKGKEDAINFGRRYEIKSITHSGVPRAEKTAKYIKQGIHKNRKSCVISMDERLDFKGKASVEWLDHLRTLGLEEKMVEKMVATGTTRPDATTWSSQELAVSLWALVAEKLSQEGIHVLISHSGIIENLEAFLKGNYSLKSLGGPVGFLQGLLITKITWQIEITFRSF